MALTIRKHLANKTMMVYLSQWGCWEDMGVHGRGHTVSDVYIIIGLHWNFQYFNIIIMLHNN